MYGTKLYEVIKKIPKFTREIGHRFKGEEEMQLNIGYGAFASLLTLIALGYIREVKPPEVFKKINIERALTEIGKQANIKILNRKDGELGVYIKFKKVKEILIENIIKDEKNRKNK